MATRTTRTAASLSSSTQQQQQQQKLHTTTSSTLSSNTNWNDDCFYCNIRDATYNELGNSADIIFSSFYDNQTVGMWNQIYRMGGLNRYNKVIYIGMINI